jgi:hypothetical protein
LKAKDPVSAKGSKYESPYAKTTPDNPRIQDAKSKEGVELAREKRAETHMARNDERVAISRETGVATVKENPSIANSLKSGHPALKVNASEAMTGVSKTDTLDGKSKAIRSKKAEADVTAEKLRRVREAAKESAKGNEVAKEAAIDKKVRLGIISSLIFGSWGRHLLSRNAPYSRSLPLLF